MLRFNLTFRLKILLSLMGTVFLFLLVLLVVVRSETSRQIRSMTEQTKARANTAFNELERLYHDELLRFGKRISQNNRIPAALQEAVEENDYTVLKDAAIYELDLAMIPLAVFTDERGKPVVTLLNKEELQNPGPRGKDLQVEKLLSGQLPSVSAYLVVQDRLFTTHGIVLHLFGEPVGTLTIGFPVDEALAQRMGNVIRAEVGFLVNGRLLSSTPVRRVPGLNEQMIAASEAGEPLSVTLEDGLWILISEPLLPGKPDRGKRVLAVSLQQYLEPLYHIEAIFRLAGLIVLIVSLLLGISISRSLAAPVKRLVAATQKVAKGDYHSHVPVRGKDELSTLAESFNRMTHDLKLKEQYRGILDKVVSPEVAEEMVKGEITLGGENREVTTLFADVRGFTSMTEGMEPQEVITMLNQYMEHAAAAVEAEGGVVDKYVGDAVMAIFGAPVSHDDDSLRAVRAALKIKENISLLNEERKLNNEPEIKVGIGINTGVAVAGNMGSVNRLNYTVLGETVNVAARLSSNAGPAEILVSQQTYEKVKSHIRAEPIQPQSMKGISKPLKVFSVQGFKRKSAKAFQTLILFMLVFLGLFGGITAWASPGLHYTSADGKFQLDFSGRLQVGGYLPQSAPAWLITETDPFVSGRLSLFTDIFLGERLYGLVELRTDRGEVPSDGPVKFRIEQAFVRWTLLESRSLHLQAGKFVSPFGAYNQRHDSAADPFIRPPVFHEYRTMICPGIAPGSNNGFIRWKFIPDEFRSTGAPVIWGVPYQAGVMLFGNVGRFSFRAAAMNSAPSSGPVQWDLDFNQEWNYSIVAHAGWHPIPELTLGVSFNYGPYSLEDIEYDLAYGSGINDYNQLMWGFNAEFTLGRTAVRAELIIDTWEVPNVIDNPRDISYYLEMSVKFLPGLYGALRYSAIHFNKISYSNGEKEQWDYNVQRLQMGLGYRFSPALEMKAEYMLNRTAGPADPKDNLLSLQWVWRF
jgi:adenylate cyclase